MADLSAHRGTASALLAAGVAALGVIGGASALVGARDAKAPAAAGSPAAAAPSGVAAAAPKHVGVTGLKKWRPAKLPKRLKLKPVVRHGRKVVRLVTVVSSAAVAPVAPASASKVRKASPKRAATKPRKALSSKRHRAPAKSAKPAKPKAPKRQPPAKPATDPAAGAAASTAAPPPAPPAPPAPPPPPAPPAPPPPPTAPTGTVAITGGSVAGRTVTAAWSGADPAATAYQWQLCDHDGHACQPIANETAQTYTLKASDIGKTIRVHVVSGAYSSTSRATDEIENGG